MSFVICDDLHELLMGQMLEASDQKSLEYFYNQIIIEKTDRCIFFLISPRMLDEYIDSYWSDAWEHLIHEELM